MNSLTQCKKLQTTFFDIPNKKGILFGRETLKERSQINMSQLIFPFNINEWQEKMKKLNTNSSLNDREKDIRLHSIISLLKRYEKKEEIDQNLGKKIIELYKKNVIDYTHQNNQTITKSKYCYNNYFTGATSSTPKGYKGFKKIKFTREDKCIDIFRESNDVNNSVENVMLGNKYVKKIRYFDFPIQERDKVVIKNSKTLDKNKLIIQSHKQAYIKYRDCKFPSFRSIDFNNYNDFQVQQLKSKESPLHFPKKISINELQNPLLQQRRSCKFRKHRIMQLETFCNKINRENKKEINQNKMFRMPINNSNYSRQTIKKRLNNFKIELISRKNRNRKTDLKNNSADKKAEHLFKKIERSNYINHNR